MMTFPPIHRIFRLGLVICLIAVAFLAFAPLDKPPLTTWDKANHILAFAVLTWLVDGSYPGGHAAAKWGWLLGYGLFIEVVQHFLPHRDASWLDLAADALGIFVYIGAATGLAWKEAGIEST